MIVVSLGEHPVMDAKEATKAVHADRANGMTKRRERALSSLFPASDKSARPQSFAYLVELGAPTVLPKHGSILNQMLPRFDPSGRLSQQLFLKPRDAARNPRLVDAYQQAQANDRKYFATSTLEKMREFTSIKGIAEWCESVRSEYSPTIVFEEAPLLAWCLSVSAMGQSAQAYCAFFQGNPKPSLDCRIATRRLRAESVSLRDSETAKQALKEQGPVLIERGTYHWFTLPKLITQHGPSAELNIIIDEADKDGLAHDSISLRPLSRIDRAIRSGIEDEEYLRYLEKLEWLYTILLLEKASQQIPEGLNSLSPEKVDQWFEQFSTKFTSQTWRREQANTQSWFEENRE